MFSLSYVSFYSLYDDAFYEYEQLTESATSESQLDSMFQIFMSDYSYYAVRPQLVTDSFPDYSIEPVIEYSYINIANQDGIFIVGSDTIDAKNIKSSKHLMLTRSLLGSDYDCKKYKNKSKCRKGRKMIVELYCDDDGYNEYVVFKHKKKIACV